MELECKFWASKGMNIYYEVRSNRKGYKAGALKEGMERSYVRQCDFVAIFDSDFQPESDFLMRAIPFLVYNPKISLVQGRWDFGKITTFFGINFNTHSSNFTYKRILLCCNLMTHFIMC